MQPIRPTRPANQGTAATSETLEPRRLLHGVSLQRISDVATGNLLEAPVIANLDGDSHLDLVAVDFSDVEVMRGNGDGTFGTLTPYAVGNDALAVAVADLNNDGANDLVTANAQDNTVSVLLNAGDGALFDPQQTYPVGQQPLDVALGDLNGDNRPDIVTANSQDSTLSILLNNGNGTFAPQTTLALSSFPSAVAIGDVNHDGKLDLVATLPSSNAVAVFLGNGNGTFQKEQDFYAGANPHSVAVADLNGDKNDDIVVADNSSAGVSVLLSNGDGTFQPAVHFATSGLADSVAVADLNHDGIPDIVATNDLDSTVSVLLGTGKGNFAAAQNYGTGPDAGAVTVGDLNGDGYDDVVTTNSGLNGASVLLNIPPTGPVPALKFPVNKATDLPLNTQLRWVANGSIEYRVIISTDRADLPTDPTFAGTPKNAVVDDVEASDFGPQYPIGTGILKRGQTYYWEIQDFNYLVNSSNFSSIRSFTTVPDTAPAIKKIADASLIVGQKYSSTGSFTDPDAGDSWTATVNYGDGSGKHTLTLDSDKKFLLHHVYDSVGDFEATVVVTDASGESATRQFTVDVGGKAIENSLTSLLEKTSPSASSIAVLLKQASPVSIAAAVTAQQQLAAAISAALASNPLDAADAKRVALILLGCVSAKNLTSADVTADADELRTLFSAGGRNTALVTAVINACANMIQIEQSS